MTTLASPRVSSVILAERFGPTLQGEGPSVGQPALFIRLSRCNLSCPACDTPYTWDWSKFGPRQESVRVSIEELYNWATKQTTSLIVITGGEPLLQQDRILPLVRSLARDGRRIEIETNGTIVPTPTLVEEAAQFNVSPKTARFAGAGSAESTRINQHALEAFASSGKAIFKFVIKQRADLDEVAGYEQRFGLTPVWVMPEGTQAETVLDKMIWLADEAIQRNWNLSTRMHTLLWGNQRGR